MHPLIFTTSFKQIQFLHLSHIWAFCQIRKIAGCACAGNAGNVFPPQRVSGPDMHHGTCVPCVPRCMPGSLTGGFLWSRWPGKRSRHSWRMRNPQFYVPDKRPMTLNICKKQCVWRHNRTHSGEPVTCLQVLPISDSQYDRNRMRWEICQWQLDNISHRTIRCS